MHEGTWQSGWESHAHSRRFNLFERIKRPWRKLMKGHDAPLGIRKVMKALPTPTGTLIISILLTALPLMAGELYMPTELGDARTPETRTLTAEEDAQAMARDWLFQAMGEPLMQRATKEIAWTRELAARLGKMSPAPELSAELRALDALEKQRHEGVAKAAAGQAAVPAWGSDPGGKPKEGWIWYPEGKPSENAPVGTRFFRSKFELPAAVRSADLRVAADDACEVFLNGTRVGTHDTWSRAARFAVEKHLKPGANVLAVQAENKPANSANPAGLILSLAITLADGKQMLITSNTSWRSAKEAVPDWQQPGMDESNWVAAIITAAYGDAPWGKIPGLVGDDNPSDSLYAGEDPAIKEFYFSVRRIKREILMKNPVVDFKQLLCVDIPIQHVRETNHEAIHRMSMWAAPGGRLLVLDGLRPGGQVRQLAPDKPGSFWRPDLSFDGKRVLFCYKPHDQKSFHLYEMNLDGTGLKQLTNSDEYDDIDPIYLPDGHIMFTTTRCNSYVRCGPFINSYVLARCDADGGNIYLISLNNEPDFVPSLMADGRVIYSRWEYTDKALWRAQKLWTVNQDGTGVAVFWGNQSIWPDHTSQPQQIPGSRRVMFCGVGHHDWWSGSVGIIDPTKGFNFPDGLTKVTRDLQWPETGNGPLDPGEKENYHGSGPFSGYSAPMPLSEEDFLISARGLDGRFRLYLMDVFGNRELIYEGIHNILNAIPVKARQRPPVHSDVVVWPGTGPNRKSNEPGVMFSADVYQGVPDLPRGSVKYLRVFQPDYKTYSTWEKIYRHSGPPVSIVQEETVKRILGEVPVEADGSVNFYVPAGQAVFFQLLDESHRCLQTMRSFTGVMPGEVRGCVGCHESQSMPTAGTAVAAIAMKRPPSAITPPPWGTESIGYERFVQPVLNQYCGKCHQGEGKAREKLDLTLRPGDGPFKEPYLTLVGAAGWGSPAKPGPGYGAAAAIPVETFPNTALNPVAVQTIRPMTYLSYKSQLIDFASSGKHHDVKVDELSRLRLIAWVDACCPYNGEEEIRAMEDPNFAGIEKLTIRPRVKTAPVIARP